MHRLVATVAVAAFLTQAPTSSAIRGPTTSSMVAVNRVSIGGGTASASGIVRAFVRAGGVLLTGDIQFRDSHGRAIALRDLTLELTAADPTPLTREQAYASLIFKGERYILPLHPSLLFPLANFIERNATFAYTAFHSAPMTEEHRREFHLACVPSADEDALLSFNSECDSGMYVAAEFKNKVHHQFLHELDFCETDALPEQWEALAVQAAEKILAKSDGEELDGGSYVNSDLTLQYTGHLVSIGNRRIVDVEGIPLRYYWYSTNNMPKVLEVSVLSVPSLSTNWTEQALEDYKAPLNELDDTARQREFTLFFQTGSVLRTFKTERPALYREFLANIQSLSRD